MTDTSEPSHPDDSPPNSRVIDVHPGWRVNVLIARALGLSRSLNIRSLNLDCNAEGVAVATVVYYPSKQAVENLVNVLRDHRERVVLRENESPVTPDVVSESGRNVTAGVSADPDLSSGFRDFHSLSGIRILPDGTVEFPRDTNP